MNPRAFVREERELELIAKARDTGVGRALLGAVDRILEGRREQRLSQGVPKDQGSAALVYGQGFEDALEAVKRLPEDAARIAHNTKESP